jgi:hypothetical protein
MWTAAVALWCSINNFIDIDFSHYAEGGQLSQRSSPQLKDKKSKAKRIWLAIVATDSFTLRPRSWAFENFRKQSTRQTQLHVTCPRVPQQLVSLGVHIQGRQSTAR